MWFESMSDIVAPIVLIVIIGIYYEIREISKAVKKR